MGPTRSTVANDRLSNFGRIACKSGFACACATTSVEKRRRPPTSSRWPCLDAGLRRGPRGSRRHRHRRTVVRSGFCERFSLPGGGLVVLLKRNSILPTQPIHNRQREAGSCYASVRVGDRWERRAGRGREARSATFRAAPGLLRGGGRLRGLARSAALSST